MNIILYALVPHSWPKRQVRVIKHNVFAMLDTADFPSSMD